MADPSKEQASAREEVMKCEREIQSIKAALRRLGSATGNDEPNSLEIGLLKIEGLPDAAKPIITLQLSSPIEEGKITALIDPSKEDEPVEGSVFSFKGVETAVATLTVTAHDADIPLGTSTPQDVAPLCKLDPMDVKEKYVSKVSVVIKPEGATSAPQSEGEDGGVEESKEDPETSQSTCTLTLQVSYKPSPKDQRDELYDLLNKTSQRKATALESLRKISMSLSRTGDSSPSKPGAKPSVKPGFLNKRKQEPTRLEKFYEKALGPNSILRQSLFVVLAARNYLIFFGAAGLMHYKGQMLALPPPV